jgi:hypothetical protein
MKKARFNLLLVTFLLIGSAGLAQYEAADNVPARPPRWACEKGYWVVESNIKTPENSIVRFYNNEQKLIYTENVTGTVLNTKKRSTLKKLKRALDKVINDWETTGVIRTKGELTALAGNKRIR